MKFNLKNFPFCCEPNHHLPDMKKEDCAIFEWIEGFEAELRERYQRNTQDYFPDFRTLIKEILGE